MTGYGNIANTKKDGSRVKYVLIQFDDRKTSNQAVLGLQNDLSSSDSQNRSPEYWRTIQNTFGLFKKHFWFENEPDKAPKYIWDRKGFRTILGKRTPAYSSGVPLLALAKFIYQGYFKKLKDIMKSKKPQNNGSGLFKMRLLVI